MVVIFAKNHFHHRRHSGYTCLRPQWSADLLEKPEHDTAVNYSAGELV